MSDPADLRQWAELMCHGETLESLAKVVGAPADIDAVVAAVSKGSTAEAQALVREVFVEELASV